MFSIQSEHSYSLLKRRCALVFYQLPYRSTYLPTTYFTHLPYPPTHLPIVLLHLSAWVSSRPVVVLSGGKLSIQEEVIVASVYVCRATAAKLFRLVQTTPVPFPTPWRLDRFWVYSCPGCERHDYFTSEDKAEICYLSCFPCIRAEVSCLFLLR